jgi:hypothetical protein
MPPQQPHRLLDFLNQALCFRAHINSIAAGAAPFPFVLRGFSDATGLVQPLQAG